MTPDLINGAFEAFGAAMLALNVKRLWRDRVIAGVHWAPTIFFTAWGAWNLYYYPSLNQWASFAGGCAIVTMNAAWLGSLYIIARRTPAQ
jgi:hypothetical protein